MQTVRDQKQQLPYITLQEDDQLQIRAGELGSEGPSHTSHAGSGHIQCSVQCESTYCSGIPCDETVYCGNTGGNPAYSEYCGSSGGGGHEMTN